MRNAPDKNPFKGVGDLLSRASPAKRGAHFLAFFIDLALSSIIAYLLFLGGNAIVSNTDTYKNNYTRYEEEIAYYQDMVVDAHIAEYLSKEDHLLVDDEDLTVKMAISQVLESYKHDDPATPEFPKDENPEEKLRNIYSAEFYQDAFVPISFANDYISRFFIEYVPLHNVDEELIHFNGQTPEEYSVNFYKRHSSNHNSLRFVYTADNSTTPYLKPDTAYELYRYLVRDNGYTRDVYDSFVSFYTSMLTDCEEFVFRANSYQTGRYLDYLAYRKSITQAADTTLIISIILAFYLVVFLPMMIFKDGRSLGRIFLRLASINVDKSEVELWKIILRSIFTAISYIFTAFFLVLLPPFNGASLILYLPYITIGTWDIALVDIVITLFILSAVNGIFMLLNHDKRNLFDLIFKTVLVDVTMLDEPDYDEKNEAGL